MSHLNLNIICLNTLKDHIVQMIPCLPEGECKMPMSRQHIQSTGSTWSILISNKLWTILCEGTLDNNSRSAISIHFVRQWHHQGDSYLLMRAVNSPDEAFIEIAGRFKMFINADKCTSSSVLQS